MRCLIIQHVSREGPGLLEEVLVDNGWELDLRCMERPGAVLPPGIDGYDAMIVLGGYMGAYEEEAFPYLYQVQRLIREAAAAGVPTLGVCLGAQLIARAFGFHVGPNPVREIGWYRLELTPDGQDSPLFRGMPVEFPVFQWHGDTFDLPAGARPLARGDTCERQAFVYAGCVWALQFHLEVTPAMITEWAELYADELREFGGPDGETALVRDTIGRWEGMSPLREVFLANIEKLLRG
ncbi:MAG: type 1 glutamine amidotransferase [Firmicutes bacterium]|nr:type 1 glutamine amidotransferase [Bacillota bacterium]